MVVNWSGFDKEDLLVKELEALKLLYNKQRQLIVDQEPTWVSERNSVWIDYSESQEEILNRHFKEGWKIEAQRSWYEPDLGKTVGVEFQLVRKIVKVTDLTREPSKNTSTNYKQASSQTVNWDNSNTTSNWDKRAAIRAALIRQLEQSGMSAIRADEELRRMGKDPLDSSQMPDYVVEAMYKDLVKH